MIERDKEAIKAMIERMRQAYNVERKALPAIFGCKEGTINNWVHFGRVPHEQLEQCRQATGCTMDWLMFGEMPDTSLPIDIESQVKQTVSRVIEDGIDFGAIAETRQNGAETVAEKMHKELQRLFNNRIKKRKKVG